MPKTKPLPPTIITDYGDDWINRLAIILAQFKKMDQAEINVVLKYIGAKYGSNYKP